VELERGVLVLKRIHVSYRLAGCSEELRAAAMRAFDAHQSHCPVAVSIGGSIAISTSITFA
jgi:uncharacterized OsmC-like protein